MGRIITKGANMKKFLTFLKTNAFTVGAIVLFLVYLFSAVFTAGSQKNPQSAFDARKQNDVDQVTAVFEIKAAEGRKLKEIWINLGTMESKPETYSSVSVKYSSSKTGSGTSWTNREFYNSGSKTSNLYNWQSLIANISSTIANYNYFIFTFKGDFFVNEVVFLDNEGDVIEVTVLSESGVDLTDGAVSKLTDEQNSFTKKTGYKNTITQKESYLLSAVYGLKRGGGYVLDGQANALGLELIAVGVGIFGANTFGLRIIPLLFTGATLLLLYFFGRKLFSNKLFALLLPAFFMLGGMPFSVGKYGSVIPIYSFFALLSVYFMYLFYTVASTKKHIFQTILYLSVSGAAFAAAVAVGSFAVFALGILIALFIGGLLRQRAAYQRAISKSSKDKAKQTKLLNDCAYRLRADFAIAAGAFIILPVLILTLSYIPAYKFLSYAAGSKNFFSIMFKDFASAFTFKYQTAYSANGSGVFSWFINYRPATLYADVNTGVAERAVSAAQNFVQNAAGLMTLFSGLSFMIIYMLSKKVTAEEYASFTATSKPFLCILFSLVFFSLPFLFVKQTDATLFYTASMFLSAVILSDLDRIYTANPDRRIFARAGGLHPSSFYGYLYLGAMILNFALIIPVYFGIAVSARYISGFYWLTGILPGTFLR